MAFTALLFPGSFVILVMWYSFHYKQTWRWAWHLTLGDREDQQEGGWRMWHSGPTCH